LVNGASKISEPRIGNPWLKLRSALRRWTKALRGLLSFSGEFQFGGYPNVGAVEKASGAEIYLDPALSPLLEAGP
jgi:hypothetical protein